MAKLTNKQRQAMQEAEADRERRKSEDDRALATVIIPQGSNALEAPIGPFVRFAREEFLTRLDGAYPDWRKIAPFPDLDRDALIELAEYCEQIASELQDYHDRESLHGVFEALDNAAGTGSQLLTINTYAAVIALVNALELHDEDANSTFIMNYQTVAAQSLTAEAQDLRERATNTKEGE